MRAAGAVALTCTVVRSTLTLARQRAVVVIPGRLLTYASVCHANDALTATLVMHTMCMLALLTRGGTCGRARRVVGLAVRTVVTAHHRGHTDFSEARGDLRWQLMEAGVCEVAASICLSPHSPCMVVPAAVAAAELLGVNMCAHASASVLFSEDSSLPMR